MTAAWPVPPTGAAILVSITVAGITALAIGVWIPLGAGLAVLAGVGIGGTLPLAQRRTTLAVVSSGLLAVFGSMVMLGAAGVAVTTGPGSASGLLVIGGIGVASLGIIGAVTGAIGRGTVREALPVYMVAGVPLAAYVLLGGPRELPLLEGTHPFAPVQDGFADAVAALLAPSPDVTAVASFGGLIAITLGSIVVFLPKVTIVELLHRRHRAPVEAARDRLVEWCATLLLYTVGSGLVVAFGLSVLIIALQGQLQPIDGLLPLVRDVASPAIAIATVEPLRWALLAVVGIVLALRILSAVPALRRLRYSPTARWLPAAAGGILLLGLLVSRYGVLWHHAIEPPLTARPSEAELVVLPRFGIWLTAGDVARLLAPPTGQWIVAGIVLGALVLVWLLLGTLVLAGWLGLVRDRGGAGGVVAFGLVAGAVGAALASAPMAALAIPVTTGVLVADLVRYAVDLRMELGTDVVARTPLIVHAFGGLAVGALAVIGVIVSETLLIDRVEPAWELPVLVGLAIGLLFVGMAINARVRRVTRPS